MCGKYILAQAAKAERAMGIRRGRWEYPLSYRVLPTEQVPVVVPLESEREAVQMRWGLIPWWAQGVPLKASTINATEERIASAPSYRDAWQRGQRCIMVMGGFYEPHVNPDGTRDPFFVRLRAREVFGVAGLWERSRREDGSYVFSCTLITVPANPLLAQVHNGKERMPAILHEADHGAWLDDTPQQARTLLRPYPEELMEAWQVSRRVNNPKLPNDASLIEPA
ncbi:MAG TPA: SOS response-associated peptidase [Steroidobacteraceae bacterium]|jgi:putative SOS response-associated peptidase YedK|nr:SOS response-associated peptidase [Steroidobacteraceae bacterium]